MIVFTWTIISAFQTLAIGKTNPLYFIGPPKKCMGNIIDQRLLAGNYHQEDSSPEGQGRFKKNLREWKSLSPEERTILRHRMDQWRGLSPEERNLYQKRYHQFQQLPPDERGRVHRRLNNWDNLSPQEREELRRVFPRH